MAAGDFVTPAASGDYMSSQPREKTVGFVGLGMMGGPMAENILKKGHPQLGKG